MFLIKRDQRGVALLLPVQYEHADPELKIPGSEFQNQSNESISTQAFRAEVPSLQRHRHRRARWLESSS